LATRELTEHNVYHPGVGRIQERHLVLAVLLGGERLPPQPLLVAANWGHVLGKRLTRPFLPTFDRFGQFGSRPPGPRRRLALLAGLTMDPLTDFPVMLQSFGFFRVHFHSSKIPSTPPFTLMTVGFGAPFRLPPPSPQIRAPLSSRFQVRVP
jgi:hypothetical protein